MNIAIVNLGRDRLRVTGAIRLPLATRSSREGDRIVQRRHRLRAAVEAADVVIDAGGMTAIPGLIDFPCARHLRRLYPAAAHRRLPRKLPAWRHHNSDLGLGGARAGPAPRRRRRQGAGDRGATMLRGLSPRRHARDRRLGDPRAGIADAGFHGARRAKASHSPRPASAR